jgi:hypothetical protein
MNPELTLEARIARQQIRCEIARRRWACELMKLCEAILSAEKPTETGLGLDKNAKPPGNSGRPLKRTSVRLKGSTGRYALDA